MYLDNVNEMPFMQGVEYRINERAEVKFCLHDVSSTDYLEYVGNVCNGEELHGTESDVLYNIVDANEEGYFARNSDAVVLANSYLTDDLYKLLSMYDDFTSSINISDVEPIDLWDLNSLISSRAEFDLSLYSGFSRDYLDMDFADVSAHREMYSLLLFTKRKEMYSSLYPRHGFEIMGLLESMAQSINDEDYSLSAVCRDSIADFVSEEDEDGA
ncbi:MAG: hypothetical protein ACI83O_000226 [Patescibacteria group bacterium]|jgi:hypothetical protein